MRALPALLLLVLTLTCNAVLAAETTPAGQKPYRIAMVLWRGETQAELGFRDYLSRQGVAVDITVMDCAQDKSKIAAFRDRIRAERPDLVYAFGTTVTAELAGTTGHRDPAIHITDIPVLFGLVATPVRSALVPAFGETGTNVTGVSHVPQTETQAQALANLLPASGRVGIIYNPAEDNAVQQAEAWDAESKKGHFTLLRQPVPLDAAGAPDATRLTEAAHALAAQKPDVVVLPSDSFLLANDKEITRAFTDAGVPTFATVEKYVRNGSALMGLVCNYNSVGRFMGHKARQILVEKKPAGTVPVETLEQFTLLLNMPVAHALQCYPPVRQLAFAEVIQAAPDAPAAKPASTPGREGR